MKKLDAIDVAILDALQRGGRLPNVALAKGVGLSPTPCAKECHMVAGGFDYLLKVRAPAMVAYRRFLGEVLSRVPGIRETHTYAVMECIKDARGVDLSHLRA